MSIRQRPARCECGGDLVPSLRFGPTPSPMETLCCFTCGAETPELYEQDRRRTPACRLDARGRRICKGCHVPFIERSHSQVFCGVPCANMALRMPNVTLDRTCAHCAQPFTVQAKTRLQRFCSKSCGARGSTFMVIGRAS